MKRSNWWQGEKKEMKGPEEKINWRRKRKGGFKGKKAERQTGERREKKIQMRVGQDPGRKVRKAEKKATQWFQVYAFWNNAFWIHALTTVLKCSLNWKQSPLWHFSKYFSAEKTA